MINYIIIILLINKSAQTYFLSIIFECWQQEENKNLKMASSHLFFVVNVKKLQK